LDWHDYEKISPNYFRPTEVDFLQAEPRKAQKIIGWEPRIFIKDLVHIMVDADMELFEFQPPGDGRKILEKHHGKWHQWDS
jgi:GDPmannose 4,6-dehydratase